jgi:hypothetical protein
MTYVWNLKLTQLRELFQIFRSRIMLILSIFGLIEGIRLKFTIFSYFWKIGKFPDQVGPPVSGHFQSAPLQTAPPPSDSGCRGYYCHRFAAAHQFLRL